MCGTVKKSDSLLKTISFMAVFLCTLLTANSQSIYRPIVLENDTIGFVLKDGNAVHKRALFDDISPIEKQRVEESNTGVIFEIATPELKAKALASWEKQRRAEEKREQSKIERKMLNETYVLMPFDNNPTARALYNSGKYSQYAMTVSLSGVVLASLAASENPPLSFAITLLSAAASIALNWKAGDELKKAGVYSRDQ